MKLYEYAEQYEALKQMAEDESIPPEALADTLESIDDEFETKVDSIACIIKDELATAEAIKKEIDALTARMKRHEATADQLKSYTMQQMQAVEKSKIETARNVVSVAKKPRRLRLKTPMTLSHGLRSLMKSSSARKRRRSTKLPCATR